MMGVIGKEKWIWCLVIILRFLYLDAELIIFTSSLDSNTSSYPLPPLNLNSDVGARLGQVRARDMSNGLRAIKYSILDVSAILKNGTILSSNNVGEVANWKFIAGDLRNNDCLDSSIEKYPQYRRQFCIDHNTGDVYTTKYFIQNPPPSGLLYKFEIKYKSPPITYDTISPHSVRIFSSCDNMTNIYEVMSNRCMLKGGFTLSLSSTDYVESSSNTTLFLTNIKLDLNSFSSFPSNLRFPSKGDAIFVRVEFSDFSRFGNITYLHPAVYFISIAPPIKTFVADRFKLSFKIFNAGAKEGSVWRPPENIISTMYISEIDFCSANENCGSLAKQYMAERYKYRSECVSNDEYDFVAKYGYCDQNSAPIITKTRGDLYYDELKRRREPSRLLSNYAIDANRLEYKLVNVTSKYVKTVRTITTSSHADCTSSLINIETPLAYFCVDRMSGKIYSTDVLIREIVPDDVFNLTVAVKDVNAYPVRIVVANILMKTLSICTAKSSSFRSLRNSSCEKSHFLAGIQVLSKNHSIQLDPNIEAYVTKLDNVSLLNYSRFYITGIRRRDSIKGFNPTEGSYMKVSLHSSTQNTTAQYYFRGLYSPFIPPIKYSYDDVLILAANIFNVSIGEESAYPIELSKWRIVIIKEMDYCSALPVCIDLYNTFEINSQLLESKCPDDDRFGFKAKYGYCADNLPPTLIKSTYNINSRLLQGGIQEVIPSSYTFYLNSSKPLNYKLVEVSSNNDFSGFTRTTPLVFHESCNNSVLNRTPPHSFFCISKTTGKIFTSSDMKDVSISTAVTFVLVVNVIDDSKYPMRNRTFSLKLLVNDDCSPASNTYEELIDCVNYSELPASKLDNSKLYFRPSKDIQRGIALKFLKEEMTQIVGLRVGIEATVTNSMQVQTNVVKSALQIISASPANNFVTIPMNIPRLAEGYTVKLGFFLYTLDNLEIAVALNDVNVGTFMLITMVSYKCKPSCIDKYSQWVAEAINASQVSGKECSKDPQFYAINFDKCLDPLPTFNGAISISKNISSGSSAVLSNCVYISPFQFSMAYWVKNGNTARRNASSSMSNTYDKITGNPLYQVSNLTIDNVQLADQGYYECVIQNRGVMLFSKEVHLKLTDVSESVLVLQTKVDWNHDYNLTSSTNYQILEKRLKTKVEDRIRAFSKTVFGSSIELVGFSGPDKVTANMRILISNANSVTRLTYCEVLHDAFDDDSRDTLNVTALELTTLDCCMKETTGEETLKGEYNFKTILAGSSVTLPCVYNSNQTFTRKCLTNINEGAAWESVDLSKCKTRDATTQKLIDLKVEVDEDNVEEISSNASAIATEDELKTTHDIEYMSDIIGSVVSVNVSNTKVTKNILNCANAVLRADRNLVIQANERAGSSRKILNDLNTLALIQKPAKKGEYFQVASASKVALGVLKPVNALPITIFAPTHAVYNDTQIRMTDRDRIDEDLDSSIFLPKEVMEKAINETVFSYAFDTDVLFLSGASAGNNTTNEIVQSKIISATVGRKNISNLNNPIVLNFSISAVENKTGLSFCKYWDPYLNDSSGVQMGGWSTEGCETYLQPNSSQIQCRCSHLTNFAIILDVSQTFANPLALQIVSYIGCGLSIVGLILTLITHLIFRKIRRKLPAKILVNLSFSLLMTLVVFLAGADRVKPRIGCRIVAMLLQYFILATFCWMAVEGLNLYRNFVKVFSGGSTGKFLMKAYAFGWGLPLVITAATAGAQWKKFGPTNPDDPKFCVVQGTPFYFALLLPVCVTLVGNTIVLILVLRGINGGSKITKDSKKQEKNKMASARIAFACAVLLGLTWLFAVLAVGDLRDFFQWLFCIFNSLQGFFIFIFYTVRSVDARREWLELFGIKQAKSTSGMSKSTSGGKTMKTSAGTTIKMQKKSVSGE